MSAGLAAARSSPFSVRHSEQIQQGGARPCSPAGPPALEAAGGLAREHGDRRQGRAEGNPLSAITAGCVSLVAVLIFGPVTTSG